MKSHSEVSGGLEYLGDTVQPSTACNEALQLSHVRCGRLPHPAVPQMNHLNLLLPSIRPPQECLLTFWGLGGGVSDIIQDPGRRIQSP